MTGSTREGGLQAPTRHALDWHNPTFYDESALNKELERVFDICHGCRRCVSLCNAFPTLFNLVDASATMEVDGVAKSDYVKVVDQCYLCDLCYLTKCPYVPPHEWNLDFPHVMLRAKAVKFKNHGVGLRERVLSATDTVGKLAGIPIIVNVVNAANKNKAVRKLLDKVLGVHPQATVPRYYSKTFRKTNRNQVTVSHTGHAMGNTNGKVVLFATCYGNYNEPKIAEDLRAVLEHNDITVTLADAEYCCGMPKLELGDLEAVERLKNKNVPVLKRWVDEGWDIIAPVPSCVLMFKQELPLLFPGDEDVIKISKRIFDPFEYLSERHRGGLLKTTFRNNLGKVSYHVACHQRVQRIGMKTRDLLALVPGTHVDAIERCSGHDGTYAVKREFFDHAVKIGKPVATRIEQAAPDHYTSDCPMAGRHLQNILNNQSETKHPISLLRYAYGI